MEEVRRFAARAVGDASADDIVSETLAIVWLKWDVVLDLPGARRAWTFGVARNVLAHARRSEARQLRLTSRMSELRAKVIPDHAEMIAEIDWIKRAIAELADHEREALLLTAFADKAHKDAAASLECSTSALNSRLSRARQRLAFLRVEGVECE